MKVVCDNCRAVYKVPDDKLTKAVNKATCRNCGHRMLIPRPKPNADPEERTLVTAVPPTPAGAPPRAGHEQPGQRSSGPDDLNMGTPMVAPRVDQTIPGPEEDFDDAPDTKLSVSNSDRQRDHRSHSAPSEQITAKEGQGRGGRNMASMPPDRHTSDRNASDRNTSDRSSSNRSIPPSDRKRNTPGPNPMSARIEGPPPHGATTQSAPMPPAPISAGARRPQSTPPRGTPASPPRSVPPPPGPRTGNYPAMALHDPANDLNWALLGTSTALIGGFLLAFLSVWNHPLVMWFGLAMTFGGGLLTFMVLLTGGRGRRPAKTLLSLVLGFMVAVVMSSTMVATKWGAERVIDAYDIHFSNVGLTGGSSTAVAGVAPPSLGSVAPTDRPLDATQPPVAAPVPGRSNDGVAVAEAIRPPVAPAVAAPAPAPGKAKAPPPAPVPAPPPPPKPGPTSSKAPAPVAAAPAPAPAPTPAPPPPPPPVPAPAADNGMATVPMNVIHVMLSNNLEVKKCFVPLYKAGTLPPRVDLKFNIMPSGTANSAQILQSNFRGSELEGCLSRAIVGITFPPTTGPGTAITYPFVLQQQ